MSRSSEPVRRFEPSLAARAAHCRVEVWERETRVGGLLGTRRLTSGMAETGANGIWSTRILWNCVVISRGATVRVASLQAPLYLAQWAYSLTADPGRYPGPDRTHWAKAVVQSKRFATSCQ